MDDVELPPRPENQPIDIYSAIVKFTKKIHGINVSVHMRYSKKGGMKKTKLPFPDNIRDGDLLWTIYGGESISVYHREDNIEYIDMNHSHVHTNLGQKLERLVREAHKRFRKIDD
ncbi:MAG: hypothetical protein Q8P79_03465 [Nanoarchaeota archaeon]|nr:hypothetical protein [Nanoarchaeota archaeon]